MMSGWSKRRNQLLQEFDTHIEIETRQNIDAGMSPEEARHAAMKKFGNVLVAAEESREVWGGLWLERLMQDIRYAARNLSGVPQYTATLVCTLVLGLGCVTTMLAVIDSILVRPVALPNPEQLVHIYAEDRSGGTSTSPHALSYRAIDDLRRNVRSFDGVSGYNSMVRPVSASDGTRITLLTEVTPGFFQMLGIQARLGRLILPQDASARVVVVSDKFWRERLHAEPAALGSAIKVSGELRTVVGVLPGGVHVPQETDGPIVYFPVSLNASGEDDFKMDSASTIARVRPGVSRQQALADAQSTFARFSGKAEPNRHLVLRSYRDMVLGDMQRPLLSLLGGVGVLLIIASANAANLQIGRAASRMPEIVVRSALGASFGRLLQQLMTESLLVSLFSAALGGAFSYTAVELVRHAYGNAFPRFDELSIRPIVLGCAGLLAVVVGVVASIAPALNVRRKTTPRLNTRNVTRKSRLPGTLVAFQVALTCVLLVISGLFVRTLQLLQNVKLGFDPRGVTTLVLTPENQNQDPQRSRQIETRLLRRFEALPGVQSVTMQTEIPFSNYNMVLNGTTEVQGRPFHESDSAFYSLVSTGFARTSGIRLLKGRGFQAEDETSAAIVVLVNEAFQRRFLAGRHPIGTSLGFHRNPGETDQDLPFAQPMRVVGVLENEIQGGDLGAPYQPMVYIDYLQLPTNSLLTQVFNMAAQYAVRSTLAPAALASELRSAVIEEAPAMVEVSLRPMEDSISKSLGERRLALRLVAGFGIVALILSAIGIYGVLAYAVALRRREIGIRMALGSSRSKIAGLVMRQAGAMVLLGLIPGIVGAWAAGSAVRSFLYGVKVLDAPTLAGVGVVLILVSASAAFLPALRAAQVNPVETLRAE